MGYPTRVQLIKRKKSMQWYVNFPTALAKALELKRGELVEWVLKDANCLLINRVIDSLEETSNKKGIEKP